MQNFPIAVEIKEQLQKFAANIASARTELSIRNQQILYDKVFFWGLLEDRVRIMSPAEWLDVLTV
ncbi:hypothetical protein AB4Y32_33510 [Paraburkholderia phymatum]|uniref:Uncharacterized protein n=1 Tax=Paraburkholderia phymatum TaxID=148447 RepID=A0ACC6UAF4_9BURK